ncbi:bifunctional diguanylate cyclase/phosphodiesterase [cf. Phormidesmis sp. LEGE 11477]|uniref:putative bifunctional diguanylate cyclase/phosphodiesterase n=1 Tax=cf. Phormidesmis sp. LEGE 11477 TaxID=1828680 RepID=UPI001880B933|nr:EAL domain-containing protein [cf. Phormidesmis sp. LEGE 11477]MBE9059875.1 EAL domain-containing protein [cf. Phormidesmis sp. LEGE 11477]
MKNNPSAALTQSLSASLNSPASASSLNTKALKQIFKLSPIGMTVLDLNGRFLSANRSFCEAVGYAEEELVSRSFTRLTHPDDVSVLKALSEQLLSGERQYFQIETRHWTKQEKPLTVCSTVTLIHDSQQRSICFLLQVVDLTEQKWMEAQLRHRAFYDGLTGLANRALFVDKVEQAVAWLEHSGSVQCAVLLLDIDRFKVINDSLGHSIGDQLLTALSGRLKACIRQYDTLARLGGDEFAILLEEIDGLDETIKVCDRIHDTLKCPFQIGSYEVFANISIGVACSDAGYEQSSDLLRNADTALYHAKGQGGGCYATFDRTMHERAVALWKMATQAQFAVERRELSLHYQPVINIKTGQVVAVEALIRWTHPQYGPISPGEFIPVMEETGVITLIGDWVLQTACQQVFQWQQQLHNSYPIKVHVNLSARQLAQRNLAQQVESALANTGLPKDLLWLEITETAIMKNSQEAVQVLEQLKALAIGLCIDDFGIGYSSLSRLQQLPIDLIKIDRSFVQHIGSRGENTEIVRTIIDLANNLGLDIVAEGVETEAQLAGLRSLGCYNIQGFYFARPMTPAAALEFIQKRNQTDVNWIQSASA